MVGIYSIKNKINGKIYVGQSWNIKKRWSAHKGNKDKIQFKREHIYLAMNKYGIDNFEFSVLIEMDENVTQADLDFQEGLFIDFYKSSNREFGYNKRDAGSRGKHSVESREKMSRTRKGVSVNKGVPKSEEAKRNMSLSRPDITGNKNPMYGKKHSLATRLKLSEKAKKRIGNKNPFFGKKHTKETLEILRKNAVKQFGYRVICHNTNKIYNSMHEVGRDFSVDPRIISEICIGKKEDLNGYKFSFEKGGKKMIYVEAPERIFPVSKKSIFLAGSITGAKNWAKEVVRSIKDFDIVVFNPRRENFPVHDPSAAEEQITWEFEMLRRASMISFWFASETLAPIVLFELGSRLMTSKPMVIGMDPNYQRRQDVEIQTKLVRPEIPIVYSMDDFTNVVSDMINQILLV